MTKKGEDTHMRRRKRKKKKEEKELNLMCNLDPKIVYKKKN